MSFLNSKLKIKEISLVTKLHRSTKRNYLERKLDEYNHTMELVRTILPVAIIVLQIIILVKII